MSIFGFGKKNTPEAAAPQSVQENVSVSASNGVNLGKQSGKLSLTKGEQVTIAKTPMLTARCEWSSNTDYDLYALVLLKDGRTLVVSTFGSQADQTPTPSVLNGAIRHMGDVGRGVKGIAEETIEIKLTDEIEAIVPIAYSAQSNGGGSFQKYKVSLGIDNGSGTQVTINAKNTSANDNIYTVAIGIIRNTADGVVVEALESYAAPHSELRPAFKNGQVVMDAGSRNLYK